MSEDRENSELGNLKEELVEELKRLHLKANREEATLIPNVVMKWVNAIVPLAMVGLITWSWQVNTSVVLNTQRIVQMESRATEIRVALQEQTDEIIALRLEIQRLLVIKPEDVYQKVADLEKKLEAIQKSRGR